ncbi:hypothetical protein [Parachitinimonas caeni]|uniref:Uncharacterized protein n=1 Tax=Parachitinimonas caeni TaxID=3031301 RepID=A0ABT7DVT1_9NEIS|nr:hypothetical protein [Parachitinimonas caeni]MDK2124162.1 hypothetical protein [Parachitinimonas caeni]
MIRVELNTQQTALLLANAGPKARRCAALALTATARQISQTLSQQALPAAFDRPTPFILRSTQLKLARPDQLAAEVRFKPRQTQTLQAEVEGGPRTPKAYERALQANGLLPAGYVTVASELAPQDSFGNLPRSWLVAILRALTDSGYGGASRGDARKQAAAQRRYGRFLVVPVGPRAGFDSHVIRQPGIYQSVPTALGDAVRPLLLFVPAAHYRPRLDLQSLAEQGMAQHFPDAFNRAFNT